MAKASKATIKARLALSPPTADEQASALVVLDALLEQTGREREGDGRVDAEPELQRELCLVIEAARREYLRRFPKYETPRGPAASRQWICTRQAGEWDYSCTFCRESIATLGGGVGGKVHPAFWNKMRHHTRVCACRIVLGTLEPVAP